MNHSIEKRIKISLFFLFVIFAYLISDQTVSAQVRVLEGNVAESRRNDGFSSGLQVELKVVGDVLKDSKGIRVTVEKAVDETGKNLIDEKRVEKDFKEINLQGDNNTKLNLELKLSERKATVIREISGYLEIFLPTKDPKSVITVANVMKSAGKPLSNSALKTSGLEVTVWTREQYEVRKKEEEERIRKEQEEKRKRGGAQPMEELGELMVAGLTKIFGGMFGGFDELSENSIVFTIKDPNAKLLDVEFEDEKGKPIKSSSSRSSGDQDSKTRVFDLDEKLSDTARVKFALLTAASISRVPFKLINVALP
ncbi:MAG: hypothetical protein WAV20_18720 [Blastocatellia bacterium]